MYWLLLFSVITAWLFVLFGCSRTLHCIILLTVSSSPEARAWGSRHSKRRNNNSANETIVCQLTWSVIFKVKLHLLYVFYHFLLCRQLLGKDLTGLGFKELQNLEQQLNEGLLLVKEKKVRVWLPLFFYLP